MIRPHTLLSVVLSLDLKSIIILFLLAFVVGMLAMKGGRSDHLGYGSSAKSFDAWLILIAVLGVAGLILYSMLYAEFSRPSVPGPEKSRERIEDEYQSPVPSDTIPLSDRVNDRRIQVKTYEEPLDTTPELRKTNRLGTWGLQAGAFAEADNAFDRKAELHYLGPRLQVQKSHDGLYRVIITGFENKAEANKFGLQFKFPTQPIPLKQ